MAKIYVFTYQKVCMVRIYELTYEGLCLYVGRTAKTLAERNRGHRYSNHTSRDGGSGDIPGSFQPWEIKLLEECSEEQQSAREQYWYDTLMPLYNIKRPGNTRKETEQLYKNSPAGKESRKLINARYIAKKKASTDKGAS
jgi:hypothetical protein